MKIKTITRVVESFNSRHKVFDYALLVKLVTGAFKVDSIILPDSRYFRLLAYIQLSSVLCIIKFNFNHDLMFKECDGGILTDDLL